MRCTRRKTGPLVWHLVCYLGNLCLLLPHSAASQENTMLAGKGWNHCLVGVVLLASLLHVRTAPFAELQVKLMPYCFLTGQADTCVNVCCDDSVLPLLFCAVETTDMLSFLNVKLLLVFFVLCYCEPASLGQQRPQKPNPERQMRLKSSSMTCAVSSVL